MAPTRDAESAVSERVVSVARELIREHGDFELSMRDLAARARVSLGTPYRLFGSKSGLIGAVLRADQSLFGARLRGLPRGDAFFDLFKALAAGVAFYAENEAFYRALFRASQAYSGRGETDPTRENPDRFGRTCRRAISEGLIDPGIDPGALGETLLDVFAANVRAWAVGGGSLRTLEAKIGFGWAAVLCGVALEPHAERMRQALKDFQEALQ